MKYMNTDKNPKTDKKKRKVGFFDWALWMLQEVQRQTMDAVVNKFKY